MQGAPSHHASPGCLHRRPAGGGPHLGFCAALQQATAAARGCPEILQGPHSSASTHRHSHTHLHPPSMMSHPLYTALHTALHTCPTHLPYTPPQHPPYTPLAHPLHIPVHTPYTPALHTPYTPFIDPLDTPYIPPIRPLHTPYTPPTHPCTPYSPALHLGACTPQPLCICMLSLAIISCGSCAVCACMLAGCTHTANTTTADCQQTHAYAQKAAVSGCTGILLHSFLPV